MILQALTAGPQHGYGVARWIEGRADDVLQIEEGSLYPALHRMEGRGWVEASWGVSENNRRAKYYRLTPSGRRRLRHAADEWLRFVRAVTLVMNPVEGTA
jgi:transcriptional regulator